MFPQRPGSRLRRLYIALLLVTATPMTSTLFLGLALFLFAEVMVFWSYGILKRKKELATGGPYGLVRNPVYCGVLGANIAFFLLAGMGLAAEPSDQKFSLLLHLNGLLLNLPVLVTFLLFFPFIVVHYLRRIRSEEKELALIFGKKWDEFCAATPYRLIPLLWRLPTQRVLLFDWSGEIALRNRVFTRIIKYAIWCTLFLTKWFYMRYASGFGVWTVWFGVAIAVLVLFYFLLKSVQSRYNKISN